MVLLQAVLEAAPPLPDADMYIHAFHATFRPSICMFRSLPKPWICALALLVPSLAPIPYHPHVLFEPGRSTPSYQATNTKNVPE